MAQHDYIIANQSGAAFRSDLNNGLAAIVSQNSGAAQPSTTYAYQWWADTTTGLLKIRNAANNAWITVGTLADANLGLLSLAGGTLTGALLLDDSGTVSAPALAFDGDANTGIWRSAADTLNVATNGVENAEFGTSEVVFNDGGADIDFRIEGDTKANLFKVDAGTDAVSIDGAFSVAGDATVSSLNGGALAGTRNRIINGDMRIAQRGTSFAAIANGTYSLDRWVWGHVGAMVCTVSQSTDVPNNTFQSSYKVDVTTVDSSIAAGDYAIVEQIIEGYNVRDLIGTTFTLSFWVKSPKTGTHCVRFANSSADRSYVKEYTVAAANTWEYKTLVITGGLITAGTWDWTTGRGLYIDFSLAAGSTFHTTADAWQTGNFYATANQVNVMDNTANEFFLTGVQLEPGSVATPFERRPIGTELALCQRYFQELTRVGWRGDATSGEIYAAWYNHSTMRVVPSVAISDVALTGFGAGVAVVGNGASYIQAEATCNSTGANRFWLAIVKLSADL